MIKISSTEAGSTFLNVFTQEELEFIKQKWYDKGVRSMSIDDVMRSVNEHTSVDEFRLSQTITLKLKQHLESYFIKLESVI